MSLWKKALWNLRDQGVEEITTRFDGAGDSGAVGDFESEDPFNIPKAEKEALNEYIWNLILSNHDVDFNNGGCSGDLIIDLESMQAHISVTWYSPESSEFVYELMGTSEHDRMLALEEDSNRSEAKQVHAN